MNIEIRRKRIIGAACDGELWVDGMKACDTAEHARHLTAQGRYHMELRKNKDKDRRVPTLVVDDKGIRGRRPRAACLKVGNGIYRLRQGEILVGRRLMPGVVLRSTEAFDLLYARIDKALLRGREVCVRVIDPDAEFIS